jgi:peptidoglycan/LPS O-acetylase OafA/YrhL
MNRPSQILIGVVLLCLAFVLFLMSMLPDQGDYLLIRRFGALLAGLLGFACVFSWGRPYTTRVAFGILSLAMIGMAVSIMMSSRPEIKPTVFAGMVALMSGAYAITGYDPLFGKKNTASQQATKNEERTESESQTLSNG